MTDLLLLNGKIRTMDPARPLAHSVACAEGRVESLDETPAAKRVIDLRGRTVVPGFIDAHVHLLAWGRRKRELDLAGVTTLEELARRVAERAKELPRGAWITGSGYELPELPHHGPISAVSPEHPVWLVRKDAHSGVANARAMAVADLSAVPPGGTLLRERGVFLENAQGLIERRVVREPDAAAFLAAQKDAMQLGITGIHDAMVDEEYLRLLRSLEDGRSLRLRVHAMFWDADPERLIGFMRSRRAPAGRLQSRAVKLFMDGSLGSSTAWMLEPFEAACGGGSGMPVLSTADAERVARVAAETGVQVCAHAIGDRANRELLGIFERVDPPGDARWRIEHAQHVHPDDLPRFARWIASVQPSHAVADRRMAEERLGRGRLGRCYPWKLPGRIALGTDAPVEKLDPRWTFFCAVTRQGWTEGEALGPDEALRGMTAGAAHAGFCDAGVLAPGRPADMAVLSHDWLEIPPEEVLRSEVVATLMDGRVGCASPAFR
jgi:hypothetical protein